MPRLSWSCRKVCRSSPTPRQNDNSWSEHPRWEPYARIGPVRFCAGGAFDSASETCRQRQPPPFHYKEIVSLVQRDARGVSQTPGLSGSAVALLDQVAPVLHSHERVPFFACSMISSPAAARRRASCLTASAERRRVRCSCDAPCAVLFPGSSIRHPHERGCHSGAAASIPAMTAMNVTAMQRRSTGAEKNTNMIASTLLAQ